MNQDKIGKFIADLRKQKNMTQEELAERLGVTGKSVSRWENGKTMPDLSIIMVLSKELNVEVSELLNGRKMTSEELIELRNTINNIIEYSNTTNKEKTTKLNKYFMAGLFCIVIVILDIQFNILSYVFKKNIVEFINGVLCGLGLLFELIGFYNNNHDITIRQRKFNIFKQNKN